MKREESRTVITTYCDGCGKELKPPYITISIENEKFHCCLGLGTSTSTRCQEKIYNKWKNNPLKTEKQ